MINLRKESAWTFNTSAGGSGGLGAFVAAKGMFVLVDPKKELQQFNFGGAGIGWSWSLPKMLRKPHLSLPKITLNGHELGVTGSTLDFPSDGVVCVTEACRGPDLTIEQLEGAAIFFDFAVGWLRGRSWTVMIAGINQKLIEAGVFLEPAWNMAIATAPAVIFMHGDNAGLQEGAGVDGMIGEIQYAGPYSER